MEQYEARARIAKALAHPSRLLILDALRQGELCVCELTPLVGADQSTVSKHLAVLRQAGLTVKRELSYATNAFFAAAPEGTGQEVFTLANTLLDREDVEYCHPEIVQPAMRRRRRC